MYVNKLWPPFLLMSQLTTCLFCSPFSLTLKVPVSMTFLGSTLNIAASNSLTTFWHTRHFKVLLSNILESSAGTTGFSFLAFFFFLANAFEVKSKITMNSRGSFIFLDFTFEILAVYNVLIRSPVKLRFARLLDDRFHLLDAHWLGRFFKIA